MKRADSFKMQKKMIKVRVPYDTLESKQFNPMKPIFTRLKFLILLALFPAWFSVSNCWTWRGLWGSPRKTARIFDDRCLTWNVRRNHSMPKKLP